MMPVQADLPESIPAHGAWPVIQEIFLAVSDHRMVCCNNNYPSTLLPDQKVRQYKKAMF